ncbi:MAG: 4Fe-4S dicluster domain-containing protein [Coriobacteriales bacterium]|jgi:Na+-translocating ferredoxin:NAD+ oxidoreductase RnfC subunit|nr:4Fe-4S dicluster domain-containing protein [Coriobacteriales bacterium]
MDFEARDRLRDAIQEAGVVGAGGAGFPAHVKLAADAEALIVNACECEPLIEVDQHLLATHTDLFLQGLEYAIHLTGATKAAIAIKAKHTRNIAQLEAALADRPNIELVRTDDFYPAGDEQVLVYDVLGRVVPRGGIPLAVGCVVHNVETLINIARAAEGVPVTTTFVTVAGALPLPATYELPIGISYREALALCGAAGDTELEGMAALDGGPMMGKLVLDLDAPITKTTKAVILLEADRRVIVEKALSDAEILRQSRAACEQCRKCTDLCPRDLLGHEVRPHLVMRAVSYRGAGAGAAETAESAAAGCASASAGEGAGADGNASAGAGGRYFADLNDLRGALACSKCGACELYACPNGLSPRRVNVLLEQQLAQAVREDRGEKAEASAPAPSPMFAYRKIPTGRLVARLGLSAWNREAPLKSLPYAPTRVTLPLKQHIGAPARAVVAVGDTVRRGTVIGRVCAGALGANVHASIDGTVTAASETAVSITSE